MNRCKNNRATKTEEVKKNENLKLKKKKKKDEDKNIKRNISLFFIWFRFYYILLNHKNGHQLAGRPVGST